MRKQVLSLGIVGPVETFSLPSVRSKVSVHRSAPAFDLRVPEVIAPEAGPRCRY